MGFLDSSKNGTVQAIAVNGENTFLKGTWLPCDTEVRITYRTKKPKYLGEDYQEISKTLAALGFKDVELVALNDLGINETKKDGQVESIAIDNKEFCEAEEWNLLSHITIQYHSQRQPDVDQVKLTHSSKDFQGKRYEEVVSALKEMGFVHVNVTALDNLSNEIIHKEGDVSKISIGETTKFSSGEIFEKTVAVTVYYHSLKTKDAPVTEPQPGEDQIRITVTSKSLKGENYQEVLAVLQEMGFTNVVSSPLDDLKKGWLHDEGDVKEVTIAGTAKFSVGDIFDTDSEVVIFYHSFASK